MPIYEYYCPTCCRKFDLLRPMSKADEPALCPTCQQLTEQRAISLFAARSREADGAVQAVAGGSGCAGCAGGNCSTCGQ